MSRDEMTHAVGTEIMLCADECGPLALRPRPEVQAGRIRRSVIWRDNQVGVCAAGQSDSACYSAAFGGAVRRLGARFWVMARIDPKIAAAIAAVG